MSGQHVDSAWRRPTDGLLGRITSILDAARGEVARAVNHATVSAYWHIGREVVEALQQGDERAAYGKAPIERLARQLTERCCPMTRKYTGISEYAFERAGAPQGVGDPAIHRPTYVAAVAPPPVATS